MDNEDVLEEYRKYKLLAESLCRRNRWEKLRDGFAVIFTHLLFQLFAALGAVFAMLPVEFITGLFGANLEADYGLRRYIPLYLILASIFALQAHKLLEEQFEPSLSKLRP